MKNITLLSRILKITNELITSEEFKAKYRIENSFSRKRKLSFVNSMYFILSYYLDSKTLYFMELSIARISTLRSRPGFPVALDLR